MPGNLSISIRRRNTGIDIIVRLGGKCIAGLNLSPGNIPKNIDQAITLAHSFFKETGQTIGSIIGNCHPKKLAGIATAIKFFDSIQGARAQSYSCVFAPHHYKNFVSNISMCFFSMVDGSNNNLSFKFGELVTPEQGQAIFNRIITAGSYDAFLDIQNPCEKLYPNYVPNPAATGNSSYDESVAYSTTCNGVDSSAFAGQTAEIIYGYINEMLGIQPPTLPPTPPATTVPPTTMFNTTMPPHKQHSTGSLSARDMGLIVGGIVVGLLIAISLFLWRMRRAHRAGEGIPLMRAGGAALDQAAVRVESTCSRCCP